MGFSLNKIALEKISIDGSGEKPVTSNRYFDTMLSSVRPRFETESVGQEQEKIGTARQIIVSKGK